MAELKDKLQVCPTDTAVQSFDRFSVQWCRKTAHPPPKNLVIKQGHFKDKRTNQSTGVFQDEPVPFTIDF